MLYNSLQVRVFNIDGFLKEKTLKSLISFMDTLEQSDLLEAQETYVELFDRGRAHCLHLFEHVHGDSRDRGQALVDLSGVYKDAGLLILDLLLAK